MVTVETTTFIEGYNSLTLTYQPNNQITINYSKMKFEPAFSEISFYSTAGIIIARIHDAETYRAIQAHIRGE